jgi:hypothetical protein
MSISKARRNKRRGEPGPERDPAFFSGVPGAASLQATLFHAKITPMKKLAAVLFAAIALASPILHAQTASPDPATIAAVNELLTAMKYREVMTASFIKLEQEMPATMSAGVAAALEKNTRLTPEQKTKAMEKAAKEIPAVAATFGATFRDPKLMDELLAEIVPLYARYFSAEELKQMAAFYRTPAGAKMLFLTPRISHEALQISQKIVMPKIGAAIGKLMQEK